MGIGIQFYKLKRVMEMNGGDCCTTLWMYLIPLNTVLKNGEDGKFYVMYILSKWKKIGKKICSISFIINQIKIKITKTKKLEVKTTVTEINNAFDMLISRLDTETKNQKATELETSKTQKQREKRMKNKMEQNTQELWDK